MSSKKLPPDFIFPKNIETKNDKYLSELSLKVMQVAVFNNTDSPLNAEDNVFLQSAIEVYARWLNAQEIMHTIPGNTNSKRKEVLELLGLGESKKKEINDRELRGLYLSKTKYIGKTSTQDRVEAVKEITKELDYSSHTATITALRTAFLQPGIPKVKLPYQGDTAFDK